MYMYVVQFVFVVVCVEVVVDGFKIDLKFVIFVLIVEMCDCD